jgi:hypothetical protein
MSISQIEKDGKQVYRYEFQPTLEDGTPIGGTQVVEADTQDGVVDALKESYTHLYRKNRELLRKEKLEGKAPEGVKAAAPEVTFQPRSLTAEERMRLARDLNDPEKVDSALDLALEAKFGAKPQEFSQTVGSNSSKAASIYAAQQAEAWRDQHPEFYPSRENVLAIASWVKNRNIEFTIENLEKAYEDLAPALETAPPSVPRTDSTPSPATADSRITAPVGSGTQRQTATPPVVPTTVSRKTGTTRGAPKQDGVTADQFRRMSNDERRKFLKEHPEGFAAKS